MKQRNGFVSNSSSSSFVISRSLVSDYQLKLIKNHIEESENYDPTIMCYPDDGWIIEEKPGYIVGRTGMDNFSMYKFLKAIGINPDLAEWRN